MYFLYLLTFRVLLYIRPVPKNILLRTVGTGVINIGRITFLLPNQQLKALKWQQLLIIIQVIYLYLYIVIFTFATKKRVTDKKPRTYTDQTISNSHSIIHCSSWTRFYTADKDTFFYHYTHIYNTLNITDGRQTSPLLHVFNQENCQQFICLFLRHGHCNSSMSDDIR